MRVINLRDQKPADLDGVLPRPELDISAAVKVVEPIIEKVRDHGGRGLRELSERFDGIVPHNLRVPRQAMKDALAEQPQELTDALEVAITNAVRAHRAQLPDEVVSEVVPGGFVYQRWVPLSRVGLYVPGGLAVYPSSVVMNVVAAQVAGVGSLVVASPPQKEFGGLPHPSVLAACEMLGIAEVIAVGGAQAIAAMAYGFTDGDYICERVDKVTGPGNIYVAAAKRAIQGVCGIDAEAGTTEIAILADGGANPSFVAADLISQAEHDPAAASVLVTDSCDLADAVQKELTGQVDAAPNRDRIRQALEGPQSAIVLTSDIEQATAVVERYGPEHLEVVTKDALERSLLIRNAGAIFVGDYSPVPLGDYVAGSNHVLPTGGTARYSSGLNTTAFLRSVQVIDYGRDALDGLTGSLVTLAKAEGLPSHGTAATIRRESSSRKQEPAAQEVSLPVREDLRDVEPYGAPQLDVPVRLNVNENPYPPSDEVIASIAESVRAASDRLNRYADRDALGLREALAEYVSQESGVPVDPAHVWAANGSNEIMLQMLQAFGGPGHNALVEAPTYSMYEEYARDTFTSFVTVESPDLEFDVDLLIGAMRNERPAVLFLPSPNNPTGTAISTVDLLRVLDAAKETGPLRRMLLTGSKPPVASKGPTSTIVIVDEAYGEFREPGEPSAIELVADNPHLVVTRTMSKAFAAAGLRLGYMVASTEVIREVMKVRLPYHLSLVTQAAAIAALGSAESQLQQVDSIRAARQLLVKELTGMGLKVLPSSSNFLLFGTFEDRHATWQKLLDRGVLIREVGPTGFLRVTVGTEQENRQFLDALKEAL
ncbi:histidinol-phosphate transaminase [Actinomycetaceae bacterium MB13-C1-2]|nr:histidinol-phosphate transaminase [Actinomycetaceae bacterium MB13-C1-2]